MLKVLVHNIYDKALLISIYYKSNNVLLVVIVSLGNALNAMVLN